MPSGRHSWTLVNHFSSSGKKSKVMSALGANAVRLPLSQVQAVCPYVKENADVMTGGVNTNKDCPFMATNTDKCVYIFNDSSDRNSLVSSFTLSRPFRGREVVLYTPSIFP